MPGHPPSLPPSSLGQHMPKPGDFLPWRFFGNDPMAARRATRPLEDLTHPYAVNYEGIVRLARVAEESGATKFVRLTGLSVGFPVYNPVRGRFIQAC